jgi:uncharacterized protein
MKSDVQNRIESALVPLVQALVDCPEAVKIDLLVTNNSTVIVNISVDKADVGKVIGKSGRHADAIRTIVKAIAASYNHRSVVEINE